MCVWLKQPTGDRGRSADLVHTVTIISFRRYPPPGSQTTGRLGNHVHVVKEMDDKYFKERQMMDSVNYMQCGTAAEDSAHVLDEFSSTSKISL